MRKAIVIFSGGQDSTTCLAQAMHHFDQVEALCFDYGQRHRIELDQAKRVAEIADIPISFVDLRFLSGITNNALTNPSQIIHSDKTAQFPNTFVPGRNHLFLSVAAAYAYERGVRDLVMGVCQTDFSGYPDCRATFIEAITESLNLAMDTAFEIHTPLMHLTKSETVLLMKKLGRLSWYAESHTCYEGKRPACGVCPACVLRKRGFEEAGIADPLAYIND